MRPIPWLIRTGLFAVGFGIGLFHNYRSNSPAQPVVIELQIVRPASSETVPARFSVYEKKISHGL